MIKITHIINGLYTGGAETMLYKLLSGINKEEFKSEVISLLPVGPVGAKIGKLGIPVYSLGMSRSTTPDPFAILRLISLLRESKPDAIQTWMYHADLMGGLAVTLGCIPASLIWGIRMSNLDPKLSKVSTRILVRILARLSYLFPQKIVCCAESGKDVHEKLGYCKKKMRVIPNGFDTSLFHPDSDARESLRRELGLPPAALLIGYVARFDPQKDHGTFFRAACILHNQFPDVHFLLVGDGMDKENETVAQWVREAGVAAQTHLLGRRDDIPRLTAGCDIFVSSACYGEGFPNVVGEAMASGVPCVVTDVGDSKLIVGDTGITVPVSSPERLAEGAGRLLSMSPDDRHTLGQDARDRIQKQYSLIHIVRMYEKLYRGEI